MNYRQGDIALISVKEIPKDLKAAKTNVLLQEGSGGNPHSFKGGEFYPKVENDVLGYLKAESTKLFHIEHNPKGDLIENGVYQIKRQNEETHEGLKPVID